MIWLWDVYTILLTPVFLSVISHFTLLCMQSVVHRHTNTPVVPYTHLWSHSGSVWNNSRASGRVYMSQQPWMLVAFSVTHISRKKDRERKRENEGHEVKTTGIYNTNTSSRPIKNQWALCQTITCTVFSQDSGGYILRMNSKSNSWRTWFTNMMSDNSKSLMLLQDIFLLHITFLFPLSRLRLTLSAGVCPRTHHMSSFFVHHHRISTVTATKPLSLPLSLTAFTGGSQDAVCGCPLLTVVEPKPIVSPNWIIPAFTADPLPFAQGSSLPPAVSFSSLPFLYVSTYISADH